MTLCALESLERRNFDVASIAFYGTDEVESSYGNEAYLKKYLKYNPPVTRIPLVLPREGDGEVRSDFFSHPVYEEILFDCLSEDADKRKL